MEDKQTDCRACLTAVAEVDKGLVRVETELKMLNQNTMKIVYALIAFAAASVGVKYIGTPIIVYVAVYVNLIAAFFVLLISVAKWRCLNTFEIWIRLSFCLSVFYASFLRIYHYQSGTALTQTEGVFANVLNLSLGLGFIFLAWSRDAAKKKYKRRETDW